MNFGTFVILTKEIEEEEGMEDLRRPILEIEEEDIFKNVKKLLRRRKREM